MEKYEKPVMEVEEVENDTILTSGGTGLPGEHQLPGDQPACFFGIG